MGRVAKRHAFCDFPGLPGKHPDVLAQVRQRRGAVADEVDKQ